MKRLGEDQLHGAVYLPVARYGPAVNVGHFMSLSILGGYDNLWRVRVKFGVVGQFNNHFARKLWTLRVVKYIFQFDFLNLTKI